MLPRQSLEIDKLTAAFVAARLQFAGVKADGTAHFKGGYVSLDEIKACTNEALLKNGLSLTQERIFHDNTVLLVTQLTHTSGQWKCSYVPLQIPDNPKDINQAWGIAMTYQRRYELYGLFSIKGEDLDPDSIHAPQNNEQKFISEAQIKRLYSMAKDTPQYIDVIKKSYNGSLNNIPAKDYDEIIKRIGS